MAWAVSATSGAPHVTKIARKPEGIGIELKALACGESGVILKLEVMEGKEDMQKKLIPSYNAGTSCLLRLTNIESIRNSYRTLIGDSAFDSVEAVPALMSERGLYLMAAVKTAHSYFPLQFINSWSKEPCRARGDSIVLKSTYRDRNNIECPIYATGWNDKKYKAIISNCGTSSKVDDAYRSRTTTAMDSKTRELITIKYTKAIKRIDIVKKFHEYFPAVDIHNHYRQGSLAFERKWKTKMFSLRFFMSLLGVCITNAF